LAAAQSGVVLTLTGPEARHAVVVQRLAVGEEVLVSDAAGSLVKGIVAAVVPGSAPVLEVMVRSVESAPPRIPELVLVQALAKHRYDEQAVAAATQLGVDRIIPWQAARSVPRWDAARAAKGRARWVQITRTEGKVARRARLPVVEDVLSTGELAERVGPGGIVLLEGAPTSLAGALEGAAATTSALYLVVGPEGSIAPEELVLFETAGALTARLGPEVLRTALAGAAALVLASHLLGRW
jgi:16S rRNA (uracil1498-N3)-methyltransferase